MTSALWLHGVPSSASYFFATDGVWAYLEGARVGWYCRGGDA